MIEEANLSRSLNAITVTLNDQKIDEFESARVQEIATGAMGGERKLIAYGSGSSGELREATPDGPAVARVSYSDGRWVAERIPEARTSEALEQSEQKRSHQKEVEYQKPVRGRLAIWKKSASGG